MRNIIKMKKYIQELINKIILLDFFGVAAEMAFWFILGLFPFLLFLTWFFAWLGKKTLVRPILDFIQNIAPEDVSGLILDTLNEAMIFKQGTFIAIFGLCITIALSANAIAVIIKGLNRAYNIEESRSFICTRILSVVMVFINSLMLFLAVNLIVLGKVILNFLIEYSAFSPLSIDIFSIVRWPVSCLALALSAYINYLILPDLKQLDKIRGISVIPGTLFFSIFWIIGSWSFSLYLSNLNAYNKVYGTIGAFAIMMVWLYYTSLIVLIGGEINSRMYTRLEKRKNNKNL